jgi:hypothetical protein
MRWLLALLVACSKPPIERLPAQSVDPYIPGPNSPPPWCFRPDNGRCAPRRAATTILDGRRLELAMISKEVLIELKPCRDPRRMYVAWLLDIEDRVITHIPLLDMLEHGGCFHTDSVYRSVTAPDAVAVVISDEGRDVTWPHSGDIGWVRRLLQIGLLNGLRLPEGPIVARLHLARTSVATR